MFEGLNKRISTSLAITIIIVLAALVVGGVYVYQYYVVPKEETKTPEIGKTEEETPKDETADWKTYRNEEYGFEVKYPEGFLIHSVLGKNMEVDGFYIVPENVTMVGYEFDIRFEENSIAERVREIEESANRLEHLKIIEISNLIVMGHRGKKIKIEIKPEKPYKAISSTRYLFKGYTLTPGFNFDEKLADKIVSTFRIID